MSLSPEVLHLIENIRQDKTHGASELARQALEVLQAAAQQSRAATPDDFLKEQAEAGQRLVFTRPAMAPLFNLVYAYLKAIAAAREAGPGSLRSLAQHRAGELIQRSLQAVGQIARHGAGLIKDGDEVLTHSYSSTVMAVLKAAANKKLKVIVTRGGAGRTGERIAAELMACDIPVTFIDDTAIGLFIPKAAIALAGADRVCADGRIINGVGTGPLAGAAKRAGVPFYACCEKLKFDPRVRSGEVDLEDRDAAELAHLPGAAIRNPHFDITPLELITGIVTEDGVLRPGEVAECLKAIAT